MISIIQCKELTDMERLELDLKYSISEDHKKSLMERMSGLNKPEQKKVDKSKGPEQIKLW